MQMGAHELSVQLDQSIRIIKNRIEPLHRQGCLEQRGVLVKVPIADGQARRALDAWRACRRRWRRKARREVDVWTPKMGTQRLGTMPAD
eukprot:5682846-Pyramimonas_sp.AAC.1